MIRPGLLVHVGAALDIAALLVLSANRVTMEGLRNGIFSRANIPLAILILIVVISAEINIKRISPPGGIMLVTTALLLLLCAFYLPPVGSSSDAYPELSYIALVLQLSVALVSYLHRSTNFRLVLISFVLIGIAFSLAAFFYTFSSTDPAKSSSTFDAAVVLGTTVFGKHDPSPMLKGRLDAALNLFDEGRVRKIVATGAGQASVESWYLMQNGVPDSSIISESSTYCTCEQANFIKAKLIDSLDMKNIAIATDPWHLPRALMMCHWQNIDAKGIPSKYRLPLFSSLYLRMREAAALQVYVLFGA